MKIGSIKTQLAVDSVQARGGFWSCLCKFPKGERTHAMPMDSGDQTREFFENTDDKRLTEVYFPKGMRIAPGDTYDANIDVCHVLRTRPPQARGDRAFSFDTVLLVVSDAKLAAESKAA